MKSKYYRDYNTIYHQPKDRFKNTSKEERAIACNNVICHRCKYNNHIQYIKNFGKCYLCGATLDRDYFKKKLMRRIGEV